MTHEEMVENTPIETLTAEYSRARDAALAALLEYRGRLIALTASSMAEAVSDDAAGPNVRSSVRALTEKIRDLDTALVRVFGMEADPGIWQSLLVAVLTATSSR